MTAQPAGERFDAIIVGSGPAGATIARELGKRKQRVLVLERGHNGPLKEGFRAAAANVNTVSVGKNLDAGRVFATGGTTGFYFAVADYPPLENFLSMGIDLSKDLQEAKKELPIVELPAELVGTQTLLVRDSAIELGYDWKKNKMLLDLSKCSSGYSYEAKWNARDYLKDAIEQQAVLVCGARVLKVLVENKKAIGVTYEFPQEQRTRAVHCAYGANIILSAGASASPVILRDSGVESVIDSGFYCHPSFALFGTVSGLRAGTNFAASMGTTVDGDIGLGDANFAQPFYSMFMIASRKVIRAFQHSKSIGVGVMVKEGLGGGLQDNGRYHKDLQESDLAKLAKGEQLARQIIQNAGGEHIIKSQLSASIGGTIRVHEHLDVNLQTEYRNLYVCDGSIIPESVKVAPTVTLVCLGKYLARHLSSECS